jgi:hypothetical protein
VAAALAILRETSALADTAVALINLSLERILRARQKGARLPRGHVPVLGELLRSGGSSDPPKAREHAVGPLFRLGPSEENRAAISLLGSVPCSSPSPYHLSLPAVKVLRRRQGAHGGAPLRIPGEAQGPAREGGVRQGKAAPARVSCGLRGDIHAGGGGVVDMSAADEQEEDGNLIFAEFANRPSSWMEIRH